MDNVTMGCTFPSCAYGCSYSSVSLTTSFCSVPLGPKSPHNDVCLNAHGHDGLDFAPASTPSDSQTTPLLLNVAKLSTRKHDKECSNNLTEEQRERRNARRQENYRKKKEENMIKLQSEKQNVSRPPLGDITNVHQPSHEIQGTDLEFILGIIVA